MDTFRVFVFYEDERYKEVTTDSPFDAENAVKMAKHLIHQGSDQRGQFTRVIITDSDDYCCFDWVKDKGIVFPPPPAK